MGWGNSRGTGSPTSQRTKVLKSPTAVYPRAPILTFPQRGEGTLWGGPPTEGRVFGLAVIMVDGCNPVWEGGSVSSFLPQRAQRSQSIYCLFLGTLFLGGESGRGNVDGLVWLMGRTFGVLEVLWRRLPEDPHPNLPPAGGRDFVGWAFLGLEGAGGSSFLPQGGAEIAEFGEWGSPCVRRLETRVSNGRGLGSILAVDG